MQHVADSRPRDNLPERTEEPHLRACGLPDAWRGTRAWRVLDAAFGDGAPFTATVAAWQADATAPPLLHYVGIAAQAPDAAELCARWSIHPALAPQTACLQAQCYGLLPGFHRLVLWEGRLQFTLCIGSLTPLLREQQFVADSVFLDAGAVAALCTDRLQAKALARSCRHGTQIALPADVLPAAASAMAPLGFRELPPGLTPDAACTAGRLEYAPAWQVPSHRDGWRHPPETPTDCVVVGAGIAGAAVAHALALRGWRVTVMDATAGPAQGASGLPAGVVAMPLTRDDAPRSRIARAGIRLVLQACRSYLQEGIDWRQCGALELSSDPESAARPHPPTGWSAQGADWTCGLDDGRVPGLAVAMAGPGGRGLWHPHAAWVRPAALVSALLSRPGIRFIGRCNVEDAEREGERWRVRDTTGTVRADARHLVLCMAHASVPLVQRIAAPALHRQAQPAVVPLAPLQCVAGSVSGGLHSPGDDTVLPSFIVRGAGHFKAHVPGPEGLGWWTGATFEPRAREMEPDAATIQAAHAFNFHRLQALSPAIALRLEPRFARGEVQSWSGMRAATVDRLPAVGPLEEARAPTLWTSTGMGARGLSYAMVCAELLAAEIGAEPLPIEASLMRAIRSTRRRVRSATPVAVPAP